MSARARGGYTEKVCEFFKRHLQTYLTGSKAAGETGLEASRSLFSSGLVSDTSSVSEQNGCRESYTPGTICCKPLSQRANQR